MTATRLKTALNEHTAEREGEMNRDNFEGQFASDVLEGLQSEPKYLQSRYFYDARGDRLFQAIMASPEYYLSDCELEILQRHGGEISAAISGAQPFELLELGSGDGRKISVLLDALHELGVEFTYCPVDISSNSLDLLTAHLCATRQWLRMEPMHANYMDLLAGIRGGERRRVFAYMGSNLGNFRNNHAVSFLRSVGGAMGPSDNLLIGLDLQKDPCVIRAAYNDSTGHTRDFNLNLLVRINRELGGEFDPLRFEHVPEYDPETGAACSYLRSDRDQEVRIAAIGRSFHFDTGERIFMEISQKYDQAMIDSLAARAGFRITHDFRDTRDWFSDQVWCPGS